MSRDEYQDIEVCILGAGPHGLAAAIHLLDAKPSIQLRVIDPSGAWLSTWHNQMDRAEITVLRSPIVHTPSPDASALRQHLIDQQLPSSGLPYDAPTTKAFASFCNQLTNQARLVGPTASAPRNIYAKQDVVFIKTTEETIRTNHLIVATNPHHQQIPDWARPIFDRQSELGAHANNIDLRDTPNLDGETIVVIGGGLSAAHLACGAAKRGATVHLVTRRPLEIRNFDTDPGWLGPKYLRAFDAELDPVKRLAIAQEARGGGTIPPWMRTQLDALVSDGVLTLHEAATVRSSSKEGNDTCQLVLTDDTTLAANRVWLATGTTPDLTALRCLDKTLIGTAFVDNYPILDDDLRLGDHPIHLMGRLTTLSLGPAAGNLWGAKRAARIITKAITSPPQPISLHPQNLPKEMSHL